MHRAGHAFLNNDSSGVYIITVNLTTDIIPLTYSYASQMYYNNTLNYAVLGKKISRILV